MDCIPDTGGRGRDFSETSGAGRRESMDAASFMAFIRASSRTATPFSAGKSSEVVRVLDEELVLPDRPVASSSGIILSVTANGFDGDRLDLGISPPQLSERVLAA